MNIVKTSTSIKERNIRITDSNGKTVILGVGGMLSAKHAIDLALKLITDQQEKRLIEALNETQFEEVLL